MNNWAYAKETSEKPFRGRMTLPRSIRLQRHEQTFLLQSSIWIDNELKCMRLGEKAPPDLPLWKVQISDQTKTFRELQFFSNEKIIATMKYDVEHKTIEFDRRGAHPTGKVGDAITSFDLPRISCSPNLRSTAYVGESSVEIVLDEGLQTISVLLDSDTRITHISSVSN